MALPVLISVLGVGGLVGAIAVVYKMIRPSYAVRVNCWFCQMNTKVPHGNRNCWDCPHCEQYNGFDKDGGYNKPIPAQHVQNLNRASRGHHGSESVMSPHTGILCDVCNRNQLLKVKQLADFVPFNEDNYDTEVEVFKRNLEHVYKLCKACAAAAQFEIHQQDVLLQSRLSPGELQKLEQTMDRSVLTDSYRDWEDSWSYLLIFSTSLHALSVICAIALLLTWLPSFLKSFKTKGGNLSVPSVENMDTFLIFLGLFLNIFSKLLLGKLRIYFIDGLCAFLWLGLMFIHMYHLQDDYEQSDPNSLLFVGCVITIALSAASLLGKRPSRTSPNMSITRLSLDSGKSDEADSSTSSSLAGDSTLLGAPAPPRVTSGFRTPASAAGLSQPLRREVIQTPVWQEHYPWNSLQSPNLSSVQLKPRAHSVVSEPARNMTSFNSGNRNSDLNSSFTSAFSEPVQRDSTPGLRHSLKSAFRVVQPEISSSTMQLADTSFSSVPGLDDIDLEIDSISLGGSKRKRHGSGVFGSNFSLNHLMTAGCQLTMPNLMMDGSKLSVPHLMTTGCKLSVPPVSRGRRPLISPAKLGCFMPRSSTPSDLHSVSSSLSQRTLFADSQPVVSDQFSQKRGLWRSHERQESNLALVRRPVIGQDSDNSRSSPRSQSSFCPVDSTTDRYLEKLPAVSGVPPWWQSGYVVLGVLTLSLLTNLIVVYTTVTRV